MNLMVCDFCVCVWILNTRIVGVSLWWELIPGHSQCVINSSVLHNCFSISELGGV